MKPPFRISQWKIRIPVQEGIRVRAKWKSVFEISCPWGYKTEVSSLITFSLSKRIFTIFYKTFQVRRLRFLDLDPRIQIWLCFKWNNLYFAVSSLQIQLTYLPIRYHNFYDFFQKLTSKISHLSFVRGLINSVLDITDWCVSSSFILCVQAKCAWGREG